jgi:hypothetical protein
MFGFDFEIYLTGMTVSYDEVTWLRGFDLVSLFSQHGRQKRCLLSGETTGFAEVPKLLQGKDPVRPVPFQLSKDLLERLEMDKLGNIPHYQFVSSSGQTPQVEKVRNRGGNHGVTTSGNGEDAFVSNDKSLRHSFTVHEQLDAVGAELVSGSLFPIETMIIDLLVIRLFRRGVTADVEEAINIIPNKLS